MTERITSGLRTWTSDHFGVGDWRYESIMELADRIDAALTERYVELPKDADGEVIHLGDVVMLPDWPLSHHEVINLVYAHDGWAIISRHGSIEASEHTVHVKPKQPTVEGVLHEFICDHEEGVRDEGDLIAEYAAKLQLKED